jgi:hypothetical protein
MGRAPNPQPWLSTLLARAPRVETQHTGAIHRDAWPAPV